MLSDRAATILIGVVSTVWAGNILAGMLQLNDYQPSEAVNGIFMAVAAALLRSRGLRSVPISTPADHPASDGGGVYFRFAWSPGLLT